MVCTLMDCRAPATHAMLIEVNGRLEAFARCQEHGRLQVNARLLQRVHPEGRMALVRLPAALTGKPASGRDRDPRRVRRDLGSPMPETT